MKENSRQDNVPNKQATSNKHRPEIRDDLDSRKNEEQETKGDDVTHNEKETKREHLKQKEESAGD